MEGFYSMPTVAGDTSVYNKDTNVENERKYLTQLVNQGDAWAKTQLDALNRWAAQNYTPLYASASASNSGGQYVDALQDAYETAALEALESAYNQNVLALEQTAAKVPQAYHTARNQAAASGEISRAGFNEYAAASGLNTGAGGQMQLSMANAQQSDQAALYQAQADALAEIENQRASLKVNYQNAVAEAIASGNLARAEAKYAEWVRQEENLLQAAMFNAQQKASYDQISYTIAQEKKADAQKRVLNHILLGGTVDSLDPALIAASGYTAAELSQYVSAVQQGRI